MTLPEVMSELSQYIRREFKIKESDKDFGDDVHLFDYGYVDSFGAVSILTFVQDRFGVKISDADLTIHPLNTVREIATLVHGRAA